MKKLLSLMLSFLLVFTLAGAVFATDTASTEDITESTVTFPLNTNTVADYSHAWGAQCSTNYITLQRNNQYVEYTVNTQKAGKYYISVNSGGRQDGVYLSVSVNGMAQIAKGMFKNTGGYQTWADQVLGVVTLSAGANVIRFTNPPGSTDATVIKSFTLIEYSDHITADSTTFQINQNTVSASGAVDKYDWCMTLWESGCVEYTLLTEQMGDYFFSVEEAVNTTGVKMSVSVNGTEQISETLADGTGYGTFRNELLGVISLECGKNVIQITNSSNMSCGIVAKNFTLTKTKEDITSDPMEFALNNQTVDLTHADAGNSSSSYATMQRGQYFAYTVNTTKEQTYLLTYTCGTSGAATKMTVSVNGMVALNEAPLADTESYSTRLPHELGIITLKPGPNVIQFQSVGGATVSTKFSLAKKRATYEIPVNEDNITSFQIGTDDSGWHTSDSTKCMIMCGTGANISTNAWVEKEVNVLEAGWYGITVNAGTTEDFIVRVSAGGVAVEGSIANTGAYGTFADHYIGMLYLEEGAQIVRLEAVNKVGFVTSFAIGDLQFDLSESKTSKSIDIDKGTVAYSGYGESGDGDLGDWYMNLRGAKTFSVTVSAEKAICYQLLANYGTNADNQVITVNVNGYEQISGKVLENNGSYTDTSVKRNLGVVNLNIGINEITFSLASGGDAIVMDSISLEQTDSFQNGSFTAWAQEGRVANVNFTGDNGGYYLASGTKCSTMREGTWLEFHVYTERERYVNMSTRAASSTTCVFSLSVNGTVEMSKESAGVISGSYVEFEEHNFECLIHIPAGYSTLRVTLNSGGVNAEKFMFTEASANEVMLLDFGLETNEGARLPYVIKQGFTGYATAELLKLGDSEGIVKLIIAQYANDTSLVDVNVMEIDLATMPGSTAITYKAPLTYKAGGGYVKGFIMDGETYEPLEVSERVDHTDIFADVAEAAMNETTAFTDATNVLNANGKYYSDHSIHDDKYDIDAIFYDSEVGNQSKVFAYIGVPKGATEENPVPAVVCVHGGAGIAFSEWVKLWNDKGYAAIAMTLTGDGPDATATSTDLHPYRGVHCWGNDAFLADYKSAAMYQNVLNVIRAHNVLRSYPGVDETKIGITGISWGGVTTTTTIGVDQRFLWAAPVYGAGYLDESETYFASYFTDADNTVAWDPANFAARSNVPTLFVNSDSDMHFSVNSTTKTAGVMDKAKISIHHKYGHDYTRGWGRPEIYTYADAMVNGTDPFMTFTSQTVTDNTLTACYTLPDNVSIASVSTYYITEDKLPYGGEITWNKITDYTDSGSSISVSVPEGATFVYASVTDSNGSVISTNYMPVK